MKFLKLILVLPILVIHICIASGQSMADAKLSMDKGDYSTAYKIFKKLADENDAFAQSELANLYTHGLGVSTDLKSGFFWHLKAANSGVPYSQYAVGDMYSNGIGVDRDDVLSLHWTEKAAVSGQRDAMSNLSLIFSNAIGIEHDFEKAYFWILKSKFINTQFNASDVEIVKLEKNLSTIQIQTIKKMVAGTN